MPSLRQILPIVLLAGCHSPGAFGQSADTPPERPFERNLIRDPGFEHKSSFWKLPEQGAVVVDRPVRAGRGALKVINDFTGQGRGMHNVVQRPVGPVVGGREYEYSVWVRGNDVRGIGRGGKPITALRWIDAQGKKIGRGLYLWAPYGTYPYRQLRLVAEAPRGAVACEVHIRSWWDCTGGVTYWDDLSLRLRPLPKGCGPIAARLEAEDAFLSANCNSKSDGISYSGSGYVACDEAGAAVSWKLDLKKGRYLLGVRYAAEAGTRHCRMTVGNDPMVRLELPPTGMPTSWAMAWVRLDLKNKSTTVRIEPIKPRIGLHFDRLDVYHRVDSPKRQPSK